MAGDVVEEALRVAEAEVVVVVVLLLIVVGYFFLLRNK